MAREMVSWERGRERNRDYISSEILRSKDILWFAPKTAEVKGIDQWMDGWIQLFAHEGPQSLLLAEDYVRVVLIVMKLPHLYGAEWRDINNKVPGTEYSKRKGKSEEKRMEEKNYYHYDSGTPTTLLSNK
ncbi:uncharacterized protein An02g14260 [Aspergillus niger]|uniref:Contig An02c0460, genomic contig n=2 Tax=Aspergillus niger TaxID=5061 RepID=A2QFE6_ASPNC|nr:uncharacterized protein An02g14260 [Aspergillus niger]CAK48857.1 unnamed protein product [Aspergillus niger]